MVTNIYTKCTIYKKIFKFSTKLLHKLQKVVSPYKPGTNITVIPKMNHQNINMNNFWQKYLECKWTEGFVIEKYPTVHKLVCTCIDVLW